MLAKILLGTNLAAAGFAGLLWWNNGKLQDDVHSLEESNRSLNASLVLQRELREVAEEAATVLRAQRAAADARAERADELREAIIRGDDETLSNVGGSLGDALSLLRGADCACGGDTSNGSD